VLPKLLSLILAFTFMAATAHADVVVPGPADPNPPADPYVPCNCPTVEAGPADPNPPADSQPVDPTLDDPPGSPAPPPVQYATAEPAQVSPPSDRPKIKPQPRATIRAKAARVKRHRRH
jgi:hypothetical protein